MAGNRLGRAQRSSSAPAVLEQVWRQPNGRVTIGAFSFTVDGHVYRGQDDRTRTPRRGSRTWRPDEIKGMQVCYDPERPGEDFALTPPRYRCGDPDIVTTDGGWSQRGIGYKAKTSPDCQVTLANTE